MHMGPSRLLEIFRLVGQWFFAMVGLKVIERQSGVCPGGLSKLLFEMAVAIGIDGCKSGWFFFRFDGGTATFGVSRTVAEILADETAETRVLIDIPIGLKERGKTERQCDLDARALLSPKRHSSVFPAPCRQALKQDTFEASPPKRIARLRVAACRDRPGGWYRKFAKSTNC